MSASQFITAFNYAAPIFCALAAWAIVHDMRHPYAVDWPPLRKRLFLGVLLALALGTVTYAAVPIPNPDWCATLDSYWWWFYGCWAV